MNCPHDSQRKRERAQEIVQSIYEEAKTMVDPERKRSRFGQGRLESGVLNIVAGRLLEITKTDSCSFLIEDGHVRVVLVVWKQSIFWLWIPQISSAHSVAMLVQQE